MLVLMNKTWELVKEAKNRRGKNKKMGLTNSTNTVYSHRCRHYGNDA